MTELPPCRCGKPWKLDAYDAVIRDAIEALVADLGDAVVVTIGDRRFVCSRRCIAYHGISSQQLLAGTSGFEEMTL